MESQNKDFWLIVIEEKEIIVSLVSRPEGKLQVRGIGEKQIWSGTDEKELISAVDISLNTCSEICHLSEDQEPDSVAFIISPFWVDEEGEIISSKAELLKKLCTQFDFKPLGFIIDDEAIAQDSDQKGSISNSFILIHLSATEFRISLIHLGKIKARAKYTHSGDLSPKELEEAISSLETQVTLPPQMIFWGKTSPTLEDQMINYPWTGKRGSVGFLHFPEIKLIDDQALFSTFSQVVTQELGELPKPQVEEESKSKEKKEPKEEVGKKEFKTDKVQEPTPPATSEEDDFGFIATDIAKFPPAKDLPSEKIKKELVPGTPLVIDEISPVPTQPSLLETDPLASTDPAPPSKPKRKFSFKLPKLKLPRLPLLSFLKKKPALLILFIVLPLVGLVLSWYFLPKVNIVLYVKPEPLEFTTSATFDPDAQSVDKENLVIPVKQLSFSITETQEVLSTGELTIGEKSKGEVKIQNRTDERVTLTKGTVISTESGLSFTLTSEVSVASKTPDFELGTDLWGETKAMLQATQIGAASNLAQNTRLTIKDYTQSQFIVTATESFTGGYAETVQAVSKEDHQELKARLISAMEEKLPQILPEKTSPQDLLLQNSTETEVEDIEYSREVGEKAQSVSATATLNVTLQLLDQETQQQVIDAFLSPTISSDLTINPDSISITVSEDEVSISASAIPQLDAESIKSDLLGLSESKAESLLQSLPRVYRYTTAFSPDLPPPLKTMPHSPKNISLDIQY